MQEASDSSADSQTAQAAGAPSMSVYSQATARPQQAGLQCNATFKHEDTNNAKLKVKEKNIEKMKKKKNRLGQRARQQLGRAKQGQAMGYVKSKVWQSMNTESCFICMLWVVCMALLVSVSDDQLGKTVLVSGQVDMLLTLSYP